MFAEMLSNSEESIFLEAIDQYFESDSEFVPKNDESNENLEEMSVKFCNKLEEDEETISTENESSYDCSFHNKINDKKKYIMMKEYVNINKSYIEDFIGKLYRDYKSEVELLSKIKAMQWTKNL